MQTLVTRNKDLKHRVNITLSSETIEQAVNNELVDIAKQACIHGFRKGRVPINIVSYHYSDSIRKSVLKKLMRHVFIKTIAKENIKPIGTPIYIINEYKVGENFNYSVEFEMYPKIKLIGLKNVIIETLQVEIQENDIDLELEMLRQANKVWKITDEEVRINDRVTINFTSTVNNKTFKNKNEKSLVLHIGTGEVIHAFEESIIGRKAKESFYTTITFPEDYRVKKLKGQTVKYFIKVKMVERSELPKFNAVFFKQLGTEQCTLQALRNIIKNNMEREVKKYVFNQLKQQIFHKLLELNDIFIPSSLIKEEMLFLKTQDFQYFTSSHKETPELSCDPLETHARNRVKVALLMQEIIKKHSLTVDENRVKTLIKTMVTACKDSNKLLKIYEKNTKLVHTIRNTVLEEQVIATLLSEAIVEEKKISFKEFKNKIDSTPVIKSF